MYTEGHWWSDRVEQPNEILQRERLGGIALRRNQTWPGNTVSWRFAEPDAAGDVAILMPNATPNHFRVIAYNRTDRVQRAEMTTWNVTAGQWTMQRATSSDGGKTLVPDGGATTLPLERSLGTTVAFAPHTTTVYDVTLAKPTGPVEQRPDIGIGRDDVVRNGRGLTVTVHSLGAQPTTGGTLTVRGADGAVLATSAIPPLAAPTDLRPRTATVRIAAPAKATSVEIALPGDAPEVTRLNNRVALEPTR